MEKKGTKFIIFIILIALLGGAIYFILQKNGKLDNKTKDKIETINELSYFVYLSEGYDTKYNGIDKLFQEESFTKDDLNNGIILTAAFRYVTNPKNNIDTDFTPNEYAEIEQSLDIEDAKILKGKQVRDAIKTLFGIDYKNEGYKNMSYKYSYFYDPETDIYLRKEATNSYNSDYSVLPLVISKDQKDDTITSQIAVAYTVLKDGKYEIYSDQFNNNLIKTVKAININEFTDEELDKMSKYTITCKDVDKNYTFEKIEAVK